MDESSYKKGKVYLDYRIVSRSYRKQRLGEAIRIYGLTLSHPSRAEVQISLGHNYWTTLRADNN